MVRSREQFGQSDSSGKIYLSVGQTVDWYAISERLLKVLRQRKLIRFCRAGHRTVLIHRESLERYLSSRTSPALGEVRGGGAK